MIDFASIDIQVRPAVCVTVPEAGVVVAVVVLTGEELARLPQVVGAQAAFPGKWYCASVSVVGKQMKFSVASGEFSSISEAEARAQEVARELGQRVKQRVFERQFRELREGEKQ
jgi:hypothetical protein